LKRINADELKLDRSLIDRLRTERRDRLILKSTVDLAHGLGMSVVVEVVEDEETCAELALLGCDDVQGYFISRPLAAPALIAWLAARAKQPEARLDRHSAI
jgi:EAL domain-containing protein (putative c-di-GMP-specific phosphodiesterase class I)